VIPALRIAIGAPIAALLLAAFVVALVAEWLGDVVRALSHSEKST
jgi:hypothetical protein